MVRLLPLLYVVSLLACTAKFKDPVSERLACKFGPGDKPSKTLPLPERSDWPIDHIIVVMQENRSFDHYFSRLNDTVANRDAQVIEGGVAYARSRQTKHCTDDIPHGWDALHRAYNQGGETRFSEISGEKERAFSYYDDETLPYYYALARRYAISDMHFAAIMGPTWPNRMYLLAGTSHGLWYNDFAPDSNPDGSKVRTILSRLQEVGVSFHAYAATASSAVMFRDEAGGLLDYFRKDTDFLSDLAADKLPQVSFVDPEFLSAARRNDEHPPGNVQIGQQFVSKIIDAFIASPAYDRGVLFLTYDEGGGFYDHVKPPPACEPDDQVPVDRTDGARFDHNGFRVPLVVVSPYVKRGYTSHVVTDHTSILRFIEARYNMPAMTKRDANANTFLDVFDFQHPDRSKETLPEAVVDADGLAQCDAEFNE